jgi:hypothetical protein
MPERQAQAVEPAVSEMAAGLPLLARPGLAAGFPNYPTARPLRRSSALQLQRQVGNYTVQRQVGGRSIQRDDLLEQKKREKPRGWYQIPHEYYDIWDNISGIKVTGIVVSSYLEPGMLGSYPGRW